MFDGMKLSALKRKARKHYLAYQSIADGYSCGAALLQHMSSAARAEAAAFNAAMDALAKIDPATPTARL